MPSSQSRPRLIPILCVALACGRGDAGGDRPTGQRGETGGTLVVAAAGEPDFLIPPLASTVPSKQVADLVFQTLASPGPVLTTVGDAGFVPGAASSWRWSADSSAIDFAIDPRARFHDGTPVRAHDVTFSHSLYTDPRVASPFASSIPAIDSLVLEDSMTVRVYFGTRSPERFFNFVTNLLVMPRHLLERVDRSKLAESGFAEHPIGSGPYRFASWTHGASMELRADTARADRPGFDRVIFRYLSDYNAAARSVAAGEADFVETLRPEGMAMVTADGPARVIEYPSAQHGYLLFNTRSTTNRRMPHPLFGDRAVRVALGMAIDRAAVVRNAWDSLAVVSHGPFQRGSWAADSTVRQLPYSVEGARRMLDSAGWRDADGDGIRERNGRPLRFSLLVPSVSATRRQIAVVLQEQLRQVGADVQVDALEPAALQPRVTQGKFDAFIHVWVVDASPSSIGQAWGGRDLEQSSNFGWYENPRVDSLIDLAVAATDRERAKGAYRQVYETIVQDAPAIFLWEPRTFAMVHKRIRFDRLRGDAWWTGIPSWRIEPGQRIARDGVGRE